MEDPLDSHPQLGELLNFPDENAVEPSYLVPTVLPAIDLIDLVDDEKDFKSLEATEEGFKKLRRWLETCVVTFEIEEDAYSFTRPDEPTFWIKRKDVTAHYSLFSKAEVQTISAASAMSIFVGLHRREMTKHRRFLARAVEVPFIVPPKLFPPENFKVCKMEICLNELRFLGGRKQQDLTLPATPVSIYKQIGDPHGSIFICVRMTSDSKDSKLYMVRVIHVTTQDVTERQVVTQKKRTVSQISAVEAPKPKRKFKRSVAKKPVVAFQGEGIPLGPIGAKQLTRAELREEMLSKSAILRPDVVVDVPRETVKPSLVKSRSDFLLHLYTVEPRVDPPLHVRPPCPAVANFVLLQNTFKNLAGESPLRKLYRDPPLNQLLKVPGIIDVFLQVGFHYGTDVADFLAIPDSVSDKDIQQRANPFLHRLPALMERANFKPIPFHTPVDRNMQTILTNLLCEPLYPKFRMLKDSNIFIKEIEQTKIRGESYIDFLIDAGFTYNYDLNAYVVYIDDPREVRERVAKALHEFEFKIKFFEV